MRRHCVNGVLALVLFGLLLGVPVNGCAQPLEPQSLIGEWIGTWEGKMASVSGPYRLTIQRIDGEKVRGRVETSGGRGENRTFPITGVLRGNHLTYGTSNFTVDLEISGSEMHGNWSGLVQREISLTKK